MRATRLLLSLCAIGLTPVAAIAHDFWLESSTHRPAVGEIVSISLRVGEHFEGDPVPRRNARIATFVAHDSTGARPVAGTDNRHPAGAIQIRQAGVTTVVYSSQGNPVELSRGRTERFLAEEGLQLPSRLTRSARREAYREQFYRFAKTMLVTGSPTGPSPSYGLRYEIVAESSPWSSDVLEILVLFEGKPMPGARVTAMHRTNAQPPVVGETDSNGRVTLDVKRRGVWLIKSVHLAEPAAGSGLDWESLWATLTFER